MRLASRAGKGRAGLGYPHSSRWGGGGRGWEGGGGRGWPKGEVAEEGGAVCETREGEKRRVSGFF